ncbi:MAG: hypothetical protein JW910_09995 [Anaerolineae bacterium]|nr:hypothetical protein [Anaerolineae bacterium]
MHITIHFEHLEPRDDPAHAGGGDDGARRATPPPPDEAETRDSGENSQGTTREHARGGRRLRWRMSLAPEPATRDRTPA